MILVLLGFEPDVGPLIIDHPSRSIEWVELHVLSAVCALYVDNISMKRRVNWAYFLKMEGKVAERLTGDVLAEFKIHIQYLQRLG